MNILTRIMVLAGLVLAVLVQPALAELQVTLNKVVDGLNAPLGLTSPPGDNRRFIWEQTGKIKILMPDGKVLPEPFLDLSGKIVKLYEPFDERGVLGLTFHPNYRQNGKFYVYYSTPLVQAESSLPEMLWWSHQQHVSEFKVSSNPNKADPASERRLLRLPWPQFNHNGGSIHFGPDGYLYISTGDGGYANDWGIGHNPQIGNGQDLSVLRGKILRIDVNSGNPYNVPRDNPFVGIKDVMPEIWAYGFRNPWRVSFDMGGNRELFAGDVGQNSYESVKLVVKGGNHGWRHLEGTHCFDYLNPDNHPPACSKVGITLPIVEYNNCNVHKDCKGLSVTGGYVYRGKHRPWHGKYFFGDWSRQFGVKDGRLYVASRNGDKWTMEDVKAKNVPSFNSYVLAFGQDNDGEVYVMTTETTGPTGGKDIVYQIVP